MATEAGTRDYHYTGVFEFTRIRDHVDQLFGQVAVNSETYCGWKPGTVLVSQAVMGFVDRDNCQVWMTLTHNPDSWCKAGLTPVDFGTLPIGVCTDGVDVDSYREGEE